MEETQDQVQPGTPTEQAPAEQSETTSEQKVEAPKLYKLPDGREVSADDLYKEHTEKLLPEFTRRSQKLSEFEKRAQETETRAEDVANKAIDESELLKNVDPNVKQVLRAVYKEINKEQAEIDTRNAKNAEWESKVVAAEEKHNGKDGLPSWKRDEMLPYMMKKEIYDPEEAYHAMHREKIEDALVKRALMDKDTSTQTETTGGEAPKKPQGKTPKTFEEAAKAAFERIK